MQKVSVPAKLNPYNTLFPALVTTLMLGLAGVSAGGPGDGVVRLTLDDAVQRALQQNFSIRVEQVSPEIALARQRQASGRFDPVFEARYNRTEDSSREPVDPFSNIRPEASLALVDRFDVGLRGDLPWGATYDFGFDTRNRRGTFNEFTPEYSSFAGINFTQPLLRNFGTDVNLAQIRVARTNVAISEWQLRGRIMDVVTNTIFAYYDLHRAQQNLGVVRQSKELAQRLLDDNIRRAEIGVMSPLDITTARADVAAREETLLLAEREVRDRSNRLKQLITDELEAFLDLRIEIAAPPMAPPIAPNVREEIALAFENRPEYHEALLDLQRRRINFTVDRNAALPRLDLVASFGLNGVDRDFGSSLDQLTTGESTSWQTGVVFSMPVPNREARGRRDAAGLEIQRALLQVRELEQSIIVELDTAVGDLENDLKRIEAARFSRQLAEEALEAEEEKLRAGTSTTFVVLELQGNLAEAQAIEIGAIADYNKSVAELYRLTGQTMALNLVDLDR